MSSVACGLLADVLFGVGLQPEPSGLERCKSVEHVWHLSVRIGLQSERRELEHGECFDDDLRMHLAMLCMQADRAERRFER